MNCERCQQDLEDLAYGELPSARAAAMRSHLSECAFCRSAQETLEREREIFSCYQEQSRLEPTPAMWHGIQARIRREPPTAAARAEWGQGGGWRETLASWVSAVFRPAVLRQLVFAAVLIAFSVTATVILLRERRGEDRNLAVRQTPVAEAPSPSPSREPATNPTVASSDSEQKKPGAAGGSVPAAPKTPPQTPPQTPPRKLGEQELITNQLARAEREYRSAIRLLDGAIAKRKGTLDPTVYEHYQSSLALIDKSIDESRQALRQNPADAGAGQFLLAAYSRKVELMQEIAMQ
jgi:hypothetical protein